MLMARRNTGSVIAIKRKVGRKTLKDLYARVTYTKPDGSRGEKRRKAKNITHAWSLVEELQAEIKRRGPESLDAAKMKFSELADYYEAHELVPVQYAGDHKVAGRRSLATPKSFLKILKKWFGRKRVRTITHADIMEYRLARLGEKTTRNTNRSITSVNRELELLRAMFNYAKRQKWIDDSPFDAGTPLILKTAERERTRLLSYAEEARLLMACTGRRSHLRGILILALDTAARRGELLQLRWSDVNMVTREITFRAKTTKTLEARSVAMTGRVHEELSRLWDLSAKDHSDGFVFGGLTEFKRSFTAACNDAGIAGLRFHDLRHTSTTRMLEAGKPAQVVMKITGHKQMTTFLRYINVNEDSMRGVADALDRHNEQMSEQTVKPS
jgi:integrase